MTNDDKLDNVLKELRDIRKLLISSLIVSGVDATIIAEMLEYKDVSSITHEKIPVAKLKKITPTVRIMGATSADAKT